MISGRDRQTNDNGASPIPRTILFVESDPVQRYVIAELLREVGFLVAEAATARQAQHFLLEIPEVVSVLLSDVGTGGAMNSFDLANWTRQHCPWIGIILTTAGHVSTPRDYRYFLLRKPYTLPEITLLLRALLP